jgi:hypothetical protein
VKAVAREEAQCLAAITLLDAADNLARDAVLLGSVSNQDLTEYSPALKKWRRRCSRARV